MIELKFKSTSGKICVLSIEELVSVDGVPYHCSTEDLRDSLIHLGGRVGALETMVPALIGVTDNGSN